MVVGLLVPGKIGFKKPISCHLYPVRVQDYSEFAAVNYHKWPICDDACTDVDITLGAIGSNGWKGASLDINGTYVNTSLTLESGLEESFSLCLFLPRCVQAKFTAGTNAKIRWWNITENGNLLASSSTYTSYNSDSDSDWSSWPVGKTEVVNFGNTLLCPVSGCTDPAATNYDATATVDDGSCQFCESGFYFELDGCVSGVRTLTIDDSPSSLLSQYNYQSCSQHICIPTLPPSLCHNTTWHSLEPSDELTIRLFNNTGEITSKTFFASVSSSFELQPVCSATTW